MDGEIDDDGDDCDSVIANHFCCSFRFFLSFLLFVPFSSDSDLLPNRPAPKNYVATGAPEFALLLSSGLGRGCNLKKYPNLKQFLQFEAKY